MNRVALDSNILLRLAVPEHPLYAITQSAIAQLRQSGRHAVLFPQMLYEFWAVATRSVAANGLGLIAAKAESLIEDITDKVPLIHDDQSVYDHWRLLARQYAVAGVNSHDMRIVAAMLAHGVPALLTRNETDFARYAGIEVLTPELVVTAAE